jgi:hypothetical protein
MGGFDGSIHPKLESTGPSLQVVFPLAFFMVNDGNKPNPILHQIMHCVICHSICQTYNVYSTTKKKKCMIFYNQQHGTTSMKKHILDEHPLAWHKWNSVNVTFDSK